MEFADERRAVAFERAPLIQLRGTSDNALTARRRREVVSHRAR
jgi:hypothetical protein